VREGWREEPEGEERDGNIRGEGRGGRRGKWAGVGGGKGRAGKTCSRRNAGLIKCNSTDIFATLSTFSTDTARRAVRRR